MAPSLFLSFMDRALPADEFVWAYKKKTSGKVVRSSDAVYFFGDSQVLSGIVPGEVTRITGRPSVNFGIPGGHALAMEYLLKRVLEQGEPPGLVVLGGGPGTLMKTPNQSTSFYYYRKQFLARDPGYPALNGRWIDYGRSVQEGVWTLVGSLPAFRLNHVLKTHFPYGIRSGEGAHLDPITSLSRQWNRNRKIQTILETRGGYWGWNRMTFPEEESCREGVQRNLPLIPSVKRSSASMESFFRMRTLLEQRKIPYLAVNMPLPVSWKDAFVRNGLGQNVLHEMLKRVFPLERIAFQADSYEPDHSHFADHTHLNGCGAMLFTGALSRSHLKN